MSEIRLSSNIRKKIEIGSGFLKLLEMLLESTELGNSLCMSNLDWTGPARLIYVCIGGLGNGVLCRGHRAISSHSLKYVSLVSSDGTKGSISLRPKFAMVKIWQANKYERLASQI